MNNPQHISLIINEMNIFSREKVFVNPRKNVGKILKAESSRDASNCQRDAGIIRKPERTSRIGKRKIGKTE
jgi:hypothetical protein